LTSIVVIFYIFALYKNYKPMGKGDKKSKRGKIIQGSYGVRRPKRKKKNIIIDKPAASAKEKKAKKVIAVQQETVVAAPVVENLEAVVETEAAPVKKKAAKTTKKVKAAEPELELGVAPKPKKGEKKEPPVKE
jgi:30S ribosomal protein S31